MLETRRITGEVFMDDFWDGRKRFTGNLQQRASKSRIGNLLAKAIEYSKQAIGGALTMLNPSAGNEAQLHAKSFKELTKLLSRSADTIS
jgi:hypothetical protein